MTALVPSVDLKKADRSSLKVNFFFENGLPVKPTININKAEIWYSELEKTYGISIYLDVDDIERIKNFKILESSFHSDKSIWIHLENYHLILSNISELSWKRLKNQNTSVMFYNNINNLLVG